MSAPQFTPGPWMRDGISVTEELPVGEKRPCIAIAHPQMHLSPGKSCERMRANARLIAAAPKLYDALAQARQVLATYQPDSAPSFYMEAIWNAETALAEASGHCPGHVASDDDPKVCRHCGTHVDEYRDEPVECGL